MFNIFQLYEPVLHRNKNVANNASEITEIPEDSRWPWIMGSERPLTPRKPENTIHYLREKMINKLWLNKELKLSKHHTRRPVAISGKQDEGKSAGNLNLHICMAL